MPARDATVKAFSSVQKERQVKAPDAGEGP